MADTYCDPRQASILINEWDFPGGSDGKASAYNEGNLGLIPGLGGSPGEGNANPLQYSCLENPMDGEACRLQSMVGYSLWGCKEWHMTEWLRFHFLNFNWKLITLQYCSGFCQTLTWVSHGHTCVPHPEPPSHLPPHPIPQGHPSAPALSTLSHASTWTGDLVHIW